MTKLQNNEYSKLLDYLESNTDKEKIIVNKNPEVKKTKPIINKEFKDLKLPKNIYCDTPGVRKSTNTNSNSNFDVIKFESFMRSKLIDNHKRLQSYERPYISVSELYSCIRKNYYNRSRYNIDLEQQFKFSYLYVFQKIGNEIHDIIQGIYDFSEVEKTLVSEKFKVKGRIDALKGNCLYEIKFIDPNKVRKSYVKEHYYQALIYSYILNSEYNYKISDICIVYFFRNLKSFSTFDLPIDNQLSESLLKRSLLLHSSLKSKTVPDPIGASNEECRFCLYKKYCEKDECDLKQPFKNKKIKGKQEITSNDSIEKKKSVFLL